VADDGGGARMHLMGRPPCARARAHLASQDRMVMNLSPRADRACAWRIVVARDRRARSMDKEACMEIDGALDDG